MSGLAWPEACPNCGITLPVGGPPGTMIVCGKCASVLTVRVDGLAHTTEGELAALPQDVQLNVCAIVKRICRRVGGGMTC